MYWEDDHDKNCGFLEEKRPTAKKEHDCCECSEKVPIGEKYLRIAGLWKNSVNSGRYFKAYEMCLKCNEDWNAVLKVFRDNGKEDACIVYGLLSEAVSDAYYEDFIEPHDFLIERWLPNYFEDLRTEEEKDTDNWKAIVTDAAKTGLQPVLPGFVSPLTAS